MRADQNTKANQRSQGEGVRYWVVGGVYTGTDFSELAGPEKREERIGPFDRYQDAFNEWARLAWRNVDDCHSRYRIEAAPD